MESCSIECGGKRKHVEARVGRSGKRGDEVISRVRYRPRNRCMRDSGSREEKSCCHSSQVSFLTDGHCKILPSLKTFQRNCEPPRRKMVQRQRRHPLWPAWILI